MAGNTHIIHRVNLEIDVPEMRLANQVKEDVVRLLYNDILPKLEKYMDTLVPIDEHVQINQLNINLENLSAAHFEQEFTQLIVQVFHEKTKKIIESSQIPKDQTDDEELIKYTKIESTLESFLFFLETGRLPWWSEKSGKLLHEQNLSEVLNHSTPEFQERLIWLLRENTYALERLLNQYSFQFIFQHIFASVRVQKGFAKEELPVTLIGLLQKFAERKKSEGLTLSKPLIVFTKKVIKQILNNNGLFSEQHVLTIFDEFLAGVASQDTKDQLDFKLLFDEMRMEITSSPLKNQPDSDFPEIEKVNVSIHEEISEKSKKVEVKEEGVFLDNAGLVLLHPFLSSFFADFDLLTDGKFKDIESQALAVHLLHYLATKQELAAEYELVMEKFLCNWDPDLPIAREVILSEAMKDESEVLLKAAVGHWTALKNTSPDGLREGFLQREGKLILNGFQDRLIIENKAQDVLLSFLPWGYSIFKLPWMESALYVEWG